MRAWLRTWRLLIGIAREIGPGVCALYITVSATAFVAPLLLALGLRPLVDGAVGHHTGSVVIGAVVTGAALLLTVSAPIGYRTATIRMERSIMVVQRRLLRLTAEAPRLEHFERPEYWDRLQLLKRSSEDLANGMALAGLGPVLIAQLLLTATLLAQVQPLLILLPLVAVPATWLSRHAEGARATAELRVAPDRRTAQHLFALASMPASGTELRVYGLGDELIRRHGEASRRVQRGVESALFRSLAANAASWLIFAVACVGSIVLVLNQAAAGRATPGDVALTLASATAVVAAAGRLVDLAGSALRVRTASEHYHWLHEQAAPVVGAVSAPPARLEHGIELREVSFSYPGSDRPTLSDVTLRLPAGAVVALVGENGAGKTTLVKLLCGMYAPTEGRIELDGADVATIDIDAYRQRITAGFQDFVRFELPVREVVGVGDLSYIDDVDDVEAIRIALAKAGAGFTDRLPDGLDTQLGSSWPGGVDLSGGQWQKLAIARSMLRPDPLLTILDEPAASLDPQTEHALFTQMAREARDGRAAGRITLLISHRFSTVRFADLIVVLENGRLVEQGTHDELIANTGLYATLYELQAAAYR